MNQGWEIKKIGEVIVENKKSTLKSKGNFDGEFPFFISGKTIKTIDKSTIDGENIYLPTGGNFFIHFYSGKASYSTDTWSLRTNRSTSIKYLFYFLLLNEKLIGEKYFKGATIKHLQKKDFKDIEIPVPPLPEQQRIVSILDKCFAAIDKAITNAEQNLKNAKDLYESYLQGVFENEEWETKTFDEVCEISSKLIDPRKAEYQNLIHVGAGNIESRTGKLFDLKTAKEENLISGKFLFDESMVLYSKIRPYLMKVVNCDFQGLCSADIYPLKPFENVISKNYLYLLLLTKEFTDYAIRGSQRAGMPKVNRVHLFAYKFKLPSQQEQQNIVRQLTTLRAGTQKLEAVYQEKTAYLEELKKSMMQKAFAGELNTSKSEVVS